MHAISFEVSSGEIVAIVGESGSGKSVTSLTILQLLQGKNIAIKGTIDFWEKEATIDMLTAGKQAVQQIRGNSIAMVFQEPMTSLNPVMTCGAQVAESIILHKKLPAKEAKKQVVELFRQVELPQPEQIFHRYPHEISGGQKQRVMIAMAISCRPDLLICDEPTTALDVLVQKNILQLIQKLQAQNHMGVIFISHDLNVVADLADRILVMYQGQIVESGTAENIFRHPQHPYTRALLACRPALYSKGQRLPTVSDFLQENKTVQVTPATDLPPASEVLLSVKNLSVWYPVRKNFFGKTLAYNKAVQNVSFDILKGEMVGLVGASGCGKTTVGRAILNLIQPTGGHLLFENKDLTSFSRKEWKSFRSKMQLIFQDPYSALNPKLTVGQAIGEPLIRHRIYPKSEVRREVEKWLEKVNLTREYYDRFPHELSGGQRQRIVIARALAMCPEFVVCDESVSALDVSVQAQVLNLLNDLKHELGFTAIFISHDLAVVRYICDRIMVMDQGEIVESGTADEVYFHPQNVFTKQLLGAIPTGMPPAKN